RAFFPPHLIGRGVTLMNLFSIGATGLAQVFTGWLHAATPAPPAAAPYQALFLFFATALLVGVLIYTFAEDRTD
ncbi:MAG: MFS transporter, partial [Pseudorhodobacter sp.]|nr:MFS transporter [Pseudorhodobacter sp.]